MPLMFGRSFALLALLATLLPPASSAGQAREATAEDPGEIRGRVFGQRGEEADALPNVMLDLSRGLLHRTAVSDARGSYSVSGLEPGRWRVQALHVGYESLALDVLVPSGGVVELDFELRARPIPLSPVLVRASPLTPTRPEGPPTPREVGEVSIRALEGSTGMVESGLAQVVRALPGSGRDAEPTDVLLMRGSAADLKLVLLDGAPVYTPFHLGGLIESFDPETMGGASLFLGGAPARFDGGLSYILDLRTRTPHRDRFGGTVSADLLTSRIRVEGPVPGGGLLVGAQMIHDLGTSVLGRGDSPYAYQDALIRGEWGHEEGPRAFLTGFWNREEVKLDVGDLSFSDGADWGNLALSGGLAGTLGETTGEIRAAITQYGARLPVADSLPLFARSESRRIRITGDLSRAWGDGVVRVGGSVDGLTSDFLARGLDSLGSVVESGFMLQGTTGGVYVEGTKHLARTLTFRGGLRLDHFSGEGGLRPAPRGALSWFLTDNAVLTLAAGRYHQFSALSSPQVEETLSNASSGTSTGQQAPPQLTVGSANHLVVSLDQILAPGLRLGLEGYVKNFSEVTGAGDRQLNASGVDLRVAREGERASGWLGYTLTWFWASDEGFLGGDSRFAGRHLLSAGVFTRITERTGAQLRVGFGDGLPYTSIPLANQAPGSDFAGEKAGNENFSLDSDNVLNEAPNLAIGPDQGFLRVEGEVFASWNVRWGGRESEIRPYVRVLNALNRRDALFYHFEPWRNADPTPLADLPILPLFGVEWVF